jgi:hypothetical protein
VSPDIRKEPIIMAFCPFIKEECKPDCTFRVENTAISLLLAKFPELKYGGEQESGSKLAIANEEFNVLKKFPCLILKRLLDL